MKKRTTWNTVWAVAVILFLSLPAFAGDWLTVNGSEEVSINSYGFYEYEGAAVLVVIVKDALPESTFLKSKDTYRFYGPMADSTQEYWSMVDLIESGLRRNKKFHMSVNAYGNITRILVVN